MNYEFSKFVFRIFQEKLTKSLPNITQRQRHLWISHVWEKKKIIYIFLNLKQIANKTIDSIMFLKALIVLQQMMITMSLCWKIVVQNSPALLNLCICCYLKNMKTFFNSVLGKKCNIYTEQRINIHVTYDRITQCPLLRN